MSAIVRRTTSKIKRSSSKFGYDKDKNHNNGSTRTMRSRVVKGEGGYKKKKYYHSSSSESEDSGRGQEVNSEDGGDSSDSDIMQPVIVKKSRVKRKKIKRDNSDSGTGTGDGSSIGSGASSMGDNDSIAGLPIENEDVDKKVLKMELLTEEDDAGSIAGSVALDDSVSVAGSTCEDSDSGEPSDISGKETAPVSPASSKGSTGSNETRLSNSKDGSESPETPAGQWEIEEIRDYIRDDFGELYNVKWKDWVDDFNTWEPLDNLLNCDDELLRFYRERKRQHHEALDSSEYVELPNGKRRRKGPSLPCVPPDPRPLDIRVQEFFDVTGSSLDEKDILKVFNHWKEKKKNSKTRWPMAKINKFLEDGIDGNLSREEITELKSEIIFLEVDKKSTALEAEIKEWERRINAITGGKPYITVENDVDMSGPPIHFQFVNDYVAGEGVEIPTDPPVGCGCGKGGASCYDERSNCCAMQFGYKYAYTRFRKVNVEQGSPIYECNSKCKCGPDCPNRVVQDGKSDHKLSIFRTRNGCGWGVKTLKSIKKGSFVTLYVGEVIKSEEADRRGKQYDKNGCTYLFDLDFNDPDTNPYSVDASEYGNVAHFINHSCSPNLGVYAVWTDCLDPNLPKLAMFALRDIAKNEELTFDYNRQLTPESRSKAKLEEEDHENNDSDDEEMINKGKKTLCLCGTSKCRKYIF